MVSRRTLLLIAGLVWAAAGVNILRIGLKSLVPLFSAEAGRLLPALGLAAAGAQFLVRCVKAS